MILTRGNIVFGDFSSFFWFSASFFIHSSYLLYVSGFGFYNFTKFC